MQQSKKRYFLVVWYWACNLFCSAVVFTPYKVRLPFMVAASIWFALAFKVTIVIHILVLKRLVSKKCMLHILKVNNKRVMVGECTPREKKIIITSLWSIIPFLACNLPFCIANLCGFVSLYLDMALLLDAGLIGPCICFAFSRNQKDRAVQPRNDAMENRAMPNVEQGNEETLRNNRRNTSAIVGCPDKPTED